MDDKEGTSTCTGSLIDPEWVLTAAHCLYQEEGLNKVPIPAENVEVFFGNEESTLRKAGVSEVYLNPNYLKVPPPSEYDFERSKNDVGLIRLSSDARTITDTIPTVSLKLDNSYNLQQGNKVLSMGWGFIDRGNRTTKLFENVSFYYTFQRLQNSFPGFFDDASGITDEDILFVFPPITCSGDSGGPLLMWNSQKNRVEMIGSSVAGLLAKNELDITSLNTAEAIILQKYYDKNIQCIYNNDSSKKVITVMFTRFDTHNRDFILQTLGRDPQGTFVGQSIDRYHCDISDSGFSFDELPHCGKDYSFRGMCPVSPNDSIDPMCQQGFEPCLYSVRHVGCQKSTVGSVGNQPASSNQGIEYNALEYGSDGMQADEEQISEGGLTTYWDKECVCTDGAEYKSLRDLPETNDEGRCNSNEFVALCTQTYPGVFIQEQLQTYWDVECVETDGITYTAVDATQCE